MLVYRTENCLDQKLFSSQCSQGEDDGSVRCIWLVIEDPDHVWEKDTVIYSSIDETFAMSLYYSRTRGDDRCSVVGWEDYFSNDVDFSTSDFGCARVVDVAFSIGDGEFGGQIHSSSRLTCNLSQNSITIKRIMTQMMTTFFNIHH
eukprot:807653-Ditylum_brightwellii.AAC.1